MSLICILCVPFPDQYFVVPSLTLVVTIYQCTINRIYTFRANLKNQPARAVIIRSRAGSKHRYRNLLDDICYQSTFNTLNLFYLFYIKLFPFLCHEEQRCHLKL